MFKVTIWCKVPARSLSHGIQALIPDSIAATFSIKLSSRAFLEEQTTFPNPDVAEFSIMALVMNQHQSLVLS
jgi:hypothetical protein